MAKILIVEDYRDLLEFLLFVLKMQGYEAKGLLDGLMLHEMIKTFVPDIILMDVKLGDISGRDLCRQIKAEKLNREVRVILMSASPGLLENYLECEASAVIEKPFDIETLFQTIKSVLVESNCPMKANINAG